MLNKFQSAVCLFQSSHELGVFLAGGSMLFLLFAAVLRVRDRTVTQISASLAIRLLVDSSSTLQTSAAASIIALKLGYGNNGIKK